MFKIVETIEEGKKTLSVVPSGWEEHGTLYWPKYRAEQLVKLADSAPDDKSSWFPMSCKLKRIALKTYLEADVELSKMLQNDDTDGPLNNISGVKKKGRAKVLYPKRRTTKNNSTYNVCNNNNFDDYNSMAEAALSFASDDNSEILTGKKGSTNAIIVSQENNISNNDYINTSESNLIMPLRVFENNNEISQDNFIFLSNDDPVMPVVNDIGNNNRSTSIFKIPETITDEKYNEILKNQKKILENQTAFGQKLAKFEAMFDTMANNIMTIISNKKSPSSSQIIVDENYHDINNFEQINSLSSLEKFENDLKDKKFMDCLIVKLSPICGTKGNDNGINNCFILIDKIFSRQFLTLCSWAGGSRDKKEKIPFKIYKNVKTFFFRLIHLSDNNFTLKNCEEFFKNVIRNSTRRNTSSMVRNSTLKRRPKNLIYKSKKQQQLIQEEKENLPSAPIENITEETDEESSASSGMSSDQQ